MSTNTENKQNNQTEVISNEKKSSRAKTVAAGVAAIGAAGAGVGVAAAMYNNASFSAKSENDSANDSTANDDIVAQNEAPIEENSSFDDMSFNEAFGAARNEGLETFEWHGETYGTRLESEVQNEVITEQEQEATVEVEPADVVTDDTITDEVIPSGEIIVDDTTDVVVEPEPINYNNSEFTDPIQFTGNAAIATNEDGSTHLILDIDNDGHGDIAIANPSSENINDVEVNIINDYSANIGTAGLAQVEEETEDEFAGDEIITDDVTENVTEEEVSEEEIIVSGEIEHAEDVVDGDITEDIVDVDITDEIEPTGDVAIEENIEDTTDPACDIENEDINAYDPNLDPELNPELNPDYNNNDDLLADSY